MYNVKAFKERVLSRRLEDIWFDCYYIQFVDKELNWCTDEFENTVRMSLNELIERFEYLYNAFPRNKYRIIYKKTGQIIYE